MAYYTDVVRVFVFKKKADSLFYIGDCLVQRASLSDNCELKSKRPLKQPSLSLMWTLMLSSGLITTSDQA